MGILDEIAFDHVVLWVGDQHAALDFWTRVIGLDPVRADEFRAGDVGFPSVRVTAGTIMDLMARDRAPRMGEHAASAGHPVHHVCLATDRAGFDGIRERLAAVGIATSEPAGGLFGARGPATRSCYFADPDGNVVEIRHYDA